MSTSVIDDSPTDNAVVCQGLTKDYGQGRGLFDLELSIPRGAVFGFVGPNGAGKTTTIRLLMDLIRADRGTATLLGLDPDGTAARSSAMSATCPASCHSTQA